MACSDVLHRNVHAQQQMELLIGTTSEPAFVALYAVLGQSCTE